MNIHNIARLEFPREIVRHAAHVKGVENLDYLMGGAAVLHVSVDDLTLRYDTAQLGDHAVNGGAAATLGCAALNAMLGYKLVNSVGYAFETTGNMAREDSQELYSVR